MRILALETSIGGGSLALFQRENLVFSQSLPASGRTAQTLAPALDAALRQLGWTAADITLVALTNGPGSFTGLRIGVTTAKTFAYLAQCHVIAFNTLDVIIHQLPADVSAGTALMDAQRGQLFAGSYQRIADGPWKVVHPCRIAERQAVSEFVTPGSVLSGPALAKLPDSFLAAQDRADPSQWSPRAETVGQLAWRAFTQGRRDDPLALQPQYYRPSYAEEKAQRH